MTPKVLKRSSKISLISVIVVFVPIMIILSILVCSILIKLGIYFIIESEQQKSLCATLAQLSGGLLGIIIAGYGFMESTTRRLDAKYQERIRYDNFKIFLLLVLICILVITSSLICLAFINNTFHEWVNIMVNISVCFFAISLILLMLYCYFLSPYYFKHVLKSFENELIIEVSNNKKLEEDVRIDATENDTRQSNQFPASKTEYIKQFENLRKLTYELAQDKKVFDQYSGDLSDFPFNMIIKGLVIKRIINNYCLYLLDSYKIYYDILNDSKRFNVVNEVDIERMKFICNSFITMIRCKETKSEDEEITKLNAFCNEDVLAILDKKILLTIREKPYCKETDLYEIIKDKEPRRIDRAINKMVELGLIRRIYESNNATYMTT